MAKGFQGWKAYQNPVSSRISKGFSVPSPSAGRRAPGRAGPSHSWCRLSMRGNGVRHLSSVDWQCPPAQSLPSPSQHFAAPLTSFLLHFLSFSPSHHAFPPLSLPSPRPLFLSSALLFSFPFFSPSHSPCPFPTPFIPALLPVWKAAPFLVPNCTLPVLDQTGGPGWQPRPSPPAQWGWGWGCTGGLP